ncbi:MAG: c-type cytochrome biogenesis protein CcsB, partial [Actinomycetia bacterium]|nr:c-type cytochrome biogenesis protein CcsB [Actinomycetes bacterium]
MSLEQYANFSNYAVASATIVLALGCLAYIAEWAFTRQITSARRQARTRQKEAVAVGAASVDVAPAASEPAAAEEATYRQEAAGRIGLSLTILSFGLLVAGALTRSLATGELRPPWGNMYEFSMMGIIAVLGFFLVMVKFAGVNWLGGIVTGFGV